MDYYTKWSNLGGYKSRLFYYLYTVLADPLLVLIEYIPFGDLLGFLRKSRGLKDNYYKNPDIKPKTTLTSQQLMQFAWQIADGMEFLSSNKVRAKNERFNVFVWSINIRHSLWKEPDLPLTNSFISPPVNISQEVVFFPYNYALFVLLNFLFSLFYGR